MNFASDNCAGAHPAIAAALAENAHGFAASYGASDLDRKVEQRFSEIFARDVAVFFVGTGTAANALALTAVNRPGGVTFCHRGAHVIADEGGAPEYFTGGGRLCPVDGELGRIDPEALEREIDRFPPSFVHAGQPMAVTITQATEAGTVYSLDDIRAIAQVCRRHGLPLHLDGARFANALVALDASPAQMTAEAGVDVVSFGATKNGCWCAEAIVFLNPEQAREMPFIRKRAAQLFSKSRFIAAQFDAYFKDGLWLDIARHSNAMAARLAAHMTASQRLRLAWPPEANEVFAIMSRHDADDLAAKGAVFHPWDPSHGHHADLGADEVLTRFVTSFATTETDVDRFGALIG